MTKLLLLYVGPKHKFRNSMAKGLQYGAARGITGFIKKEKPPEERLKKKLTV